MNHEQLRALCLAATRGPYDTMAGMPSNVLTDGGLRVARCDFDGTFNAQTAANGRYFAAMSPNTTLALLDEIERLRTAAQAVVDRWDTPSWKDVPATANYINKLRMEILK